MIDKNYLIWLAGFYEGEGSCGFYVRKSDGAKALRASVWQKESQILDEIKFRFGYGNVSLNRGYDKYGGCYKYEVNCSNAQDFLEKLLPYMRSDRKINQAIESIDKWKNRHIGMSLETRKRFSIIMSKKAKIALRDGNGKFIKLTKI